MSQEDVIDGCFGNPHPRKDGEPVEFTHFSPPGGLSFPPIFGFSESPFNPDFLLGDPQFKSLGRGLRLPSHSIHYRVLEDVATDPRLLNDPIVREKFIESLQCVFSKELYALHNDALHDKPGVDTDDRAQESK